MMLWAGGLAQQMYLHASTEVMPPGCASDLDSIAVLTEKANSYEDRYFHGKVAAVYAEWLRLRTIAALGRPMIWSQVEAVARGLEAHKTLKGREVKAIMDTDLQRQMEQAST